MGYLATVGQHRTGEINREVKDDPLPVGVYWIDVFDDSQNTADIATFHDWLALNETTVRLIREEHYNASADWNIFETEPHRIWALFEVTAPTLWGQGPSLGFPSEGRADMVSGDTIQKPDPPKTIFDDEFEWPAWTGWAVGGGVVVLGLVALVALRR